MGRRQSGRRIRGAGGGFTSGGGFGSGAGAGGGAGAGRGFAAGGGLRGGASSISLPLADLARSEPVVIAVALGQTLLFAGLLMACCWWHSDRS